jgi:hypothetical protein
LPTVLGGHSPFREERLSIHHKEYGIPETMAYLNIGNWVLNLDLEPPERGAGCGLRKLTIPKVLLGEPSATLNLRSNGGGADVGNGDIGKERPAASSRLDTLVF